MKLSLIGAERAFSQNYTADVVKVIANKQKNKQNKQHTPTNQNQPKSKSTSKQAPQMYNCISIRVYSSNQTYFPTHIHERETQKRYEGIEGERKRTGEEDTERKGKNERKNLALQTFSSENYTCIHMTLNRT